MWLDPIPNLAGLNLRAPACGPFPPPLLFPPVRNCGALLLGLVALTGFFGCSKEAGTNGAISGTIETDQARVASRHGGRAAEILVAEGDSVRPRQSLVRLAAPELGPRREQVEALLAELRAGARTEELATAEAESAAISAELEFARADERRTAQLANTGAIAASDRDRAVSRAAALEKSLVASRSRHQLLAAGARPERIAQVEAQLREIGTQIHELEVVAPVAATVETLHVKLGDVLPPGAPVATLLYTDSLWVRVYVPATWLGHLQLGGKVRVEVDSFPGKEFAGEIEQIARAAEFTPRNVQTSEDRVKQVFGVKIRLPAGAPELRAGMSADVFFPNLPPKKP